ncbi:NO-inducible flavohemoprotein [Solimicrobium silvestre]|uniref:Flavohemoprotein n=1 Tax=Solimicrobium silvestre TaxID=2099400 RepID=A0A2S9GU21_9BURK|nr:NO-inducible flavohemoprotein [Solimicrobium silvestre]PRC91204.1 Oxidoreductase NAD-binding domain [Solimicrobium silvestre]
MLSIETRAVLDASVPVLREHGVAITTSFYASMFAAHPELKNIFNMGNQKSGAQQQSLASALFAYAANYDNQAALLPVVSRIVQKHVSVGIRADHYPIVGKYLLGGIAHVLGAAATPALLAAWGDAYGDLAGLFISEEQAQYRSKSIEPGQCRQVTVNKKVIESEQVTSFYLVATDGNPLPAFLPGQYISVAMQVADGGKQLRQLRQYSLSDAADKPYWRISVKREVAQAELDAGMVSGLIHDQIQVGDTLWVGMPCGDFVLHHESELASNRAPLILISAGVGITPVMSMLHSSLAKQQRQVRFFHATRSGKYHALRSELHALAQHNKQLDIHICYEHPETSDVIGRDYISAGKLDLNAVNADLLPTNGHYYLCGPSPFMQQQRRALIARGIPEAQIRHEVFGPELIGHLA